MVPVAKPIRVDQIDPEEVDWLWRERVPRKMFTFVAGRPDQGKGLLWAHIAAEVSRAGGRVLISAWEDSDALVTRPRLEAAGAVLENIETHRFVLGPSSELERQVNDVATWLIDGDIDLLVLDPFNAHLRGVGRYSDGIRELLNPLTKVIEQTGTAVIVIEHALKRVPRDGGPLAAVGGGSSGLVAACRMGFVFGTDPEDPDRRVLCHVKGNIRDRAKPIAFEIDTSDIEIYDPVKDADITKQFPLLVFDEELEAYDPAKLFTVNPNPSKIGRPDDKKTEASEWLTAYLAAAGGPVRAGLVIEDARQSGMSTKTLKRAATEMGVLRFPPGGGKNCTWQLPDEVLQMMGVDPSGNDAKPLLSDEDFDQLLGGDDADSTE